MSMADIRNQQWRISASAKCRKLHFKAVVWRLLPGRVGGGNSNTRFSALLKLGNVRLQIDSKNGHKIGEGRWWRSKYCFFRILAKLFPVRSRVDGVCKSVWRYRLGREWKRLLAQAHLAPTMQDLTFIIQPPPWKTLREVVTRFLALFSLIIKLILHNLCLMLLLIVLKPSLKEVLLYVQNKQGKLKVVVGKDFIEVAVSYVIHVVIQLALSHFSMKFGRSKFIGFIVIKVFLEKARGWKTFSQPQMIEGLQFR